MILIKRKKTLNLCPLKKEKIFTFRKILTKIEFNYYNNYNEKY
jgi:hypothetical protein